MSSQPGVVLAWLSLVHPRMENLFGTYLVRAGFRTTQNDSGSRIKKV